MSIRLLHLASLLAVSMVAAAIGGVAATWWIADEEFRDVLDDDLQNQSEMLAEMLANNDVSLTADKLRGLLEGIYDDDEEETLWVTVYDTRLGIQVSNLPHTYAFEGKREGAVDFRHDGYRWHGYREDADSIVVQLMRREDLYEDVQGEVLEDIIAPTLIGSAINLALLALLITFFLWPITRLSKQLELRSADSLSPLTAQTPAKEVQVLRDALNSLIRDVDAVLTRERHFASDVAHELRTPLTTLKLEAAGDDPDLPVLRDEIRRVSHVVEQLLTLARLEQQRWQRAFDSIALAGLCERVMARFEESLREADIALQSELTQATVHGDATLLEILFRNLLQNVVQHAAQATFVKVDLQTRSGSVCLRVCDDGAGLPANARRRVSTGFTPMDSRGEGLGLGLAICQRIVAVHGASMSLRDPESATSGCVVEVRFPVNQLN